MYTIFNPWKGFPSYKTVYLDIDFQRMRANGQEAYGTAQTAYNAALAMGGDVVIMVGNIDSGTSGNVNLAANYDNNVSWVGLHKDRSKLGSIIGGPIFGVTLGYSIEIRMSNVSFVDLNSSNAAGNGGLIDVVCFGPCSVDGLISTGTGGNGGDIQTEGPITINDNVLASGFGFDGGDIEIGEGGITDDLISRGNNGGSIEVGKNCTVNGTIDTKAADVGGDVEIGENTDVFGTIYIYAGTIKGGDLTLKSCFIHDVVMYNGTTIAGTILSNNSVIEGSIDAITGTSVFNDTVIVSPTFCIADLHSSNAQFQNCMFISGAGFSSINSTTPLDIIANNTLQNNDFGVNVNVLVGNNNVTNALFTSPLP